MPENQVFAGKSHSGFVWANNDYDRWDHSILDGWVEDDLQTAVTPDYDYTDTNDDRAIPCPRDLEDFARLWVSGVSNTLSRLPAGSTVTLSWNTTPNLEGDIPYTGNPAIDLFQAADADGGIGYQTNLTTASNQINNALCRYVGRIGLGSNLLLNDCSYSNCWAGDHYIWCGVTPGSGELDLTIFDANSNQLAQSSQIIQIQDIKQMYERWTVGDAPGSTPMSNAVPAQDNFSPGYPTQAFQYSYDPAYDTNDTYILFVHGYNMESWEKDRFAETAYKRLYWQGYQGRFGSFRWPTYQHFYQYDPSETAAWNSGIGLKRLLTSLNAQYPGSVYVLGHSMGNVVTGEALRLAGTNEIVNTYVASQAAVSARAYDNTLPADLTNAYYFHVQTPDSEGHYYTNGAPSYFSSIGGAGKFISFFNSQDWALGKWDIDQATKPDLLYTYVTPSLTYPSGYYYAPSPITRISLIFTNDTYQIFSRCVQSYSFPLGAETNLVHPFPYSLCVNLQSAPYNFLSTHPGHSQQFRFDNPTTTAYWKQLLSSFQIEP